MTNLPPTKTSLLRVDQDLQFARLGYELLDQKRNILVIELLNLVDQTVAHQERMESTLGEAYRTLEEAVLRMGKLRVTHLSSTINIDSNIRIGQRRVMGVVLPSVHTEFTGHPPYYSLMGTSFWVDNAVKGFRTALELMGRFAELKISLLRLAQEVKKTIRKVNALEKIAIPALAEAVGYIRSRLEENERDMFVLMKLVKARLEAKGREPAATSPGPPVAVSDGAPQGAGRRARGEA
jgi:V/A-type H+-transporting ATPase subunit D